MAQFPPLDQRETKQVLLLQLAIDGQQLVRVLQTRHCVEKGCAAPGDQQLLRVLHSCRR